MKTLTLKNFCAVFLFLLTAGSAQNVGQASDKDGRLVVLVTWGDMDNTPANNVHIEAYGWVSKARVHKTFLLKMMLAGKYEATLPPGVFDVFISEGTSTPRCKRVLINPERATYWNLKLEKDDVYLEKSQDLAKPVAPSGSANGKAQ